MNGSSSIDSAVSGLRPASRRDTGREKALPRQAQSILEPASGPGELVKTASIFRTTAPLDFMGIFLIRAISSIQAAVSSKILPEVSMVTVPLIW